MAVKKVKVGNKEVTFKASAATPRIYRFKTGRDIIKDMILLSGKLGDAETEEEQLMAVDLSMFEEIAYVMAVKEEDTGVEAWLDQFEMFSIYDILPIILEMWSENAETTVTPPPSKKK